MVILQLSVDSTTEILEIPIVLNSTIYQYQYSDGTAKAYAYMASVYLFLF